MKSINSLYLAIFSLAIFSSCQNQDEKLEILIKNSLDINRSNETVTIPYTGLESIEEVDLSLFGLIDMESGDTVLYQHIDSDDDGIADALIFQPEIKANSEKSYKLVKLNKTKIADSKVFSRLAPERTDDYAWENDKVAFRTFGPTAQKMKEEGIVTKPIYGTEGGTLSSGIDCWLKKVDYPIIDKWYEKHTTGKGSYHEDTGEGLDNFHVGSSRGCGGLGVYSNEELYVSKNFTSYMTLSNGPIRTSFILDYEPWKANELTISEQKRISLDLGCNLMNVKAKIDGTETITVGLTLHENDGETSVDTVNGWFSYWQPHADSELGTAIVIDPKYYLGYTKIVSEEKDKSQLLVHLKVFDGKIDYYTGFGWKGSGQFSNKTMWEDYLKEFALKAAKPLEIVIN